MRGPTILVLTLILAILPVRAEETTTAAETTERGRSLARILDMVLLPDGRDIEGKRSLGILLDATPSLQGAAFAEALDRALLRQASRLGETRVVVLKVGGRDKTAWHPVGERPAIVDRVKAIVGAPVSSYQNVYADLRRAAAELKRRGGTRDLLLVTLENGDAEDELEETAKELERAGVRVLVVARQAFLSDTYGVGRTAGVPPGLELKGPESAFIELPWGFLFQQGRANEGVASGFPVYGLSRVASATDGRVFLWYPPSASEHRCFHLAGSCPFCTGDHLPEGTTYRAHRLKALAPVAGSRRDAYGVAARDPYFKAVLEAWTALSKKGLVASRPSVKRTAGGLAPQRSLYGRLAPIGASASFTSQANKAERLQLVVEEIRKKLERSVAGVPEGQGLGRYRAIADATVVQLHLLRVNLVAFVAWCREVGPVMAGKQAEEFELPEIPFYSGSERIVGIGWTNLALCHGVKPFREVYLPGGDAMQEELDALDAVITPFLDRYAHTPFATFVRRSGLARFHLTVRGKYVPPPKRKIPGSSTEDTTTPSDRPARGGPGTGTSGGPTTGGD